MIMQSSFSSRLHFCLFLFPYLNDIGLRAAFFNSECGIRNSELWGAGLQWRPLPQAKAPTELRMSSGHLAKRSNDRGCGCPVDTSRSEETTEPAGETREPRTADEIRRLRRCVKMHKRKAASCRKDAKQFRCWAACCCLYAFQRMKSTRFRQQIVSVAAKGFRLLRG